MSDICNNYVNYDGLRNKVDYETCIRSYCTVYYQVHMIVLT